MVSACNAQFTNESAFRNSLQHFIHISGLKPEQKLCLETVVQKLAPTDWFLEEFNLPIVTASTERHMETRTCLCFSCNTFGIDNERPG